MLLVTLIRFPYKLCETIFVMAKLMIDLIGHAIGLVYPNSKADVAIKTVNDPLDSKQRTALFCEMKILSNLEIHINLVNMLGSCTTEFIKTGEVFMLIEYCEQGNIKISIPSIIRFV